MAARVIHIWNVVVDNIGSVYRGHSGFLARKAFNIYKKRVRLGIGRVGDEVVLLKDGEISQEYSKPVQEKLCSKRELLLGGYEEYGEHVRLLFHDGCYLVSRSLHHPAGKDNIDGIKNLRYARKIARVMANSR